MKSHDVEISDPTRELIGQIEFRFRMAAELLKSAMNKNTNRPFMDGDEYANSLREFFGVVIEDLRKTRRGRIWFPNAIREALDSPDFEKFSRSLSNTYNPHIPLILPSSILENFAKNVGRSNSTFETLDNASKYLGEELGELPVGMSLVFKDLTGTVRFGSHHHYGYPQSQSISRMANLRRASRSDGMAEAEFNLSNNRKKKIALALDRVHGTLDYFDQSKLVEECWPYCGLYTPGFFISQGVPVLGMGYFGAPSVMMASQALQKLLGFPHIKKISGAYIRPKKLFRDLSLLNHEVRGVFFETFGVGYIGVSAGFLFYHVGKMLLAEDPEEGTEIPLANESPDGNSVQGGGDAQ